MSKRDDRKFAAALHITEMNERFYRETQDAIATAARYRESKAETFCFAPARFSKTKISVDGIDAVSAVMSAPAPVAVLDFASYHNPGGGYANGAWAQEEALCAESNLFSVLDALYDDYYKPHKKSHNGGLYTSDGLYLHDICFVRDDNWRTADVIVVAAPNAGAARSNGYDEEEISQALKRRIEAVLNIAANEGVDNLVLGAFGCGVFANSPQDTAKIFKEWLEEHDGIFDNVVFAVPAGGANYEAFCEVFGKDNE